MNDVVKAVAYDRGKSTMNGEQRYFTLIAMVVGSTEPIITEEYPELVMMGAADISSQLKNLKKFKPPHKFGDISHAIIDVACMVPDDLEEL